MKHRDLPSYTLRTPAVITLFSIAAVFIAIQIGLGDVVPLLSLACVVLVAAYILFLSRFTWQLALLLCYLGFSYRPAGFEFGPTEVTCAMGAGLAAATYWQKRSVVRSGLLKDKSFQIFTFFLSLWIAYLVMHLIYNCAYPYRPADFVFKNAIKSYFAVLAPALMLCYFIYNPSGLRLGNRVFRTIALLLLIGLLVNIAIVGYGLATHSLLYDQDQDDFYTGTLFIPGINLRDNPYILRGLAPACVLFGSVSLLLGRKKTEVGSFLAFLLVGLGLVGSVISGGRAAVVTAIILVCLMLLVRKKIAAVLVILFISGTVVLAVNVLSSWINHHAPVAVARPLQWLMVSGNNEARESIDSSSLWRRELFDMSMAEWRSDPRIFWTGRATYGYSVADLVAVKISGGFEALEDTSLRRGVTHNLLSDLLITYGLIGCILYYALVLAMTYFLWSVYRKKTAPPQTKPLSLVYFISFAVYLVIASIGGGYYTVEMIWGLIVLVAILYRDQPDPGPSEIRLEQPLNALNV